MGDANSMAVMSFQTKVGIAQAFQHIVKSWKQTVLYMYYRGNITCMSITMAQHVKTRLLFCQYSTIFICPSTQMKKYTASRKDRATM